MITAQSQRNPLWRNTLLGFSNTTIGGYGCTITCVGMLAGLTPPETNDRLKAVGGYAAPADAPAQKNLILWTKIKNAIPWLEFEDMGRGYTYDNDRVSAAITKNGGCLVEVDAAPIGGTKHWVLYIGNRQLIDPWDGTTKPTSSYQALGFAIINKIGEPPMATDTVAVPKADFENLVNKSTKYDAFLSAGYASADDVAKKIADLETQIKGLGEQIANRGDTINSLNQLITEKNATLTSKETVISSLETKVSEQETRLNSLLDQAKTIPEMKTQLDYLTEQKEKWTEAEKTYNRSIAQLKAENARLRSAAWSILFKTIWNNLSNAISSIFHK